MHLQKVPTFKAQRFEDTLTAFHTIPAYTEEFITILCPYNCVSITVNPYLKKAI